MILQSLYSLYNRKQKDLPPEGFEEKQIPFLIVLNRDGTFAGLQDTRTPNGKKLIARQFRVPKGHDRSGKNAWQIANLMWDHYGYVLGWPKSDAALDKTMAENQHGTFTSSVKTLFSAYPSDHGLNAVYRFLTSGQIQKVFQDPLWPECKKIPGCNMSFRLSDELALVCESDNVRSYVSATLDLEQDDEDNGDLLSSPEVEGRCIVTGERAPIARLHPRTPILGAKSNAKVVSFQKNMGFDSYGKQQGYNAPTSKHAAFAYTTALNHLLAKGSRQKLQVGDATTVFWAEKAHDIEEMFVDFFGEPPKGDSEQDNATIKALYNAPKTGAVPLLDDKTSFYVLGLAPNAARIAIRFWYQGSVGEVTGNIKQHFDDISIVHADYEMPHCSLNEILASTAVETKDLKKTNRVYFRGKHYDVTPNLAGDFMKTILTGTPYPQTLLSAVILRIRAEQSKKNKDGKSLQNVTYARATLIKAVLVRQARFYRREEKEVGMALDKGNSNIGYRLGRLFSVLEKIQEEANPGINATIRDRFYGSASGTPIAAFPHLMKLKNHHLSKLENKGRAVNFERNIGEIMDGISDFPTHLSLQDQGRFAVGYYHQRQDFFTKREQTNLEGE